MTNPTTTRNVPDAVTREGRTITYRWTIPATAGPDSIEAVELVVSHNKHRKTIDARLHRIAVRGAIVTWAMSIEGRGPRNSHTLLSVPCSRYSAKQLEDVHARAVRLLDQSLAAGELVVSEIFEEARHYDA